MIKGDLDRDGFCLLRQAVDAGTVSHLLDVCRDVFEDDSDTGWDSVARLCQPSGPFG